MTERSSTRFRQMLERPGIIVTASAYDCLSARIMEEVGFEVIFHGGYNTAAPLLGLPDIGLITMTEMVGYARNMAAAVKVPVICDVDDGFGDVINVMRTTREVIRSGLAGMYIEDQQSPKRCPALGGTGVVPARTMIRKLRAALKVRAEEDPDFVLIARTHASRAVGMAEAIERGVAYAQEGAEVIFVDLCYSDKAVDELHLIAEKIGPHAHVLANMTETVGRPLLSAQDLQDMGFKIAFYPVTALITAAGALERVFRLLKQKGTTRDLVAQMMPFEKIGQLLHMDEIRKIETELASDGNVATDPTKSPE